VSFVERREAARGEPTGSPQVRQHVNDGSPDGFQDSNLSNEISRKLSQTGTCLAANVCIAIDESGSVCSKPGVVSTCGNIYVEGVCDDYPRRCERCDLENDCPKFNTNTKDFVNAFIAELDAQVSAIEPTPSVSFGIVTFSTNADNDIPDTPLGPYVPASAAQTAVTNLVYEGGFTNIQDAILKCEAGLEQAGGAKFIVLLADGEPTTCNRDSGCRPNNLDTTDGARAGIDARNEAVDSGIAIAALAIETSSEGYIKSLASDPSLEFAIDTYAGLLQSTLASDIATAVADQICCRSCSDRLECRGSETCDIGGRRRKLRFGALEASGCCRAQ